MRVGVVGGGVIGMSTVAALLDAGHAAIGYEAGVVMGERSAGSTRVFRLAHADPELVRVAQVARHRFEQWSAEAGRPMLVNSGCVVTGTDMADRAAAMAAAGADYELIGPGSDRLRLPVVEAPAVALLDVGGGVVDVDGIRAHLTARAAHAVVHEPVYALGTRWNVGAGRQDPVMEHVVVKTVCALLNGEGGVLLIGVDDDGTVLGIEPDLATLGSRQNIDGYELFLRQLLENSLSAVTAHTVQIRFHDLHGRQICEVAVAASGRAVFAKSARGSGTETSEFWVRVGNSTRQLHGDDMVQYQEEHWG